MHIKQDPQNYRVYLKIDNLTQDVRRGIRQGYYKIGKDLRAYGQKKILEGPKTGRIYLVRTGKKQYKRHQASAPGEFPANLTGNLRKSIAYTVRGWESLEIGAGPAGPGGKAAPYAKDLEEGTDKMAPRPYLKRTIEETQSNVLEHFETEIKRALTRKD